MTPAEVAKSRGGLKPMAGDDVAGTWPKSYLEQTLLPLTSLAFLLPLIIVYEVGTWLWATDASGKSEQRIIAYIQLQWLLHAKGQIGRILPALMVVAVMLATHVARADCWRVSKNTLMWMWVESLALSIPLWVIGAFFAHHVQLQAHHTPMQLPAMLVMSIGAGVYEEFVFRFALVAVLDMFFTGIFRLKGFWAGLLMVVISALAFSGYHYLGHETITLQNFAFRTIAGIYFSIVFMFRGFGVTAGCHAFYDVLAHLIRALS